MEAAAVFKHMTEPRMIPRTPFPLTISREMADGTRKVVTFNSLDANLIIAALRFYKTDYLKKSAMFSHACAIGKIDEVCAALTDNTMYEDS